MTCPFCFESHHTLGLKGIDRVILNELMVVGSGVRYCVCPTCGSSDRDRLIYIYLLEIFRLLDDRNIKVLHVAPERIIYEIFKRILSTNYIVGSLSPHEYPFVKGFKQFDLRKTHFENDCFDLIICNHVLEHITEEKDAINELKRILKPTGTCILQVPIALGLEKTIEGEAQDSNEREKRYGQSDHVRLYGKDYAQRLKGYDLRVTTYNLYKEYSEYGINQLEDIYIVQKY